MYMSFVFIQDYVHIQTHIYHTTKPRVSKQIAFRKHANVNTLLILCDTPSIGQWDGRSVYVYVTDSYKKN